MRNRRLLSFLAVGLLVPAVLVGEEEAAAPPRRALPVARKAHGFTPEREAAARTFVQRHHPELGGVLDRLQLLNRREYEKAVVELFETSEALAELEPHDPERHLLALDAWKARSRVELLAAQLSRAPTPELESQLRQALEAQIAVEVRQQRHERDQARARLRRAEAALAELEQNRANLVQSRYDALIQNAQRGRKPGETAAAKPPPKATARAATMRDGAR